MISVTVKPRNDNNFDIYVHAENGELLMSSAQGYERAADAEEIVRKLFAAGNSPVKADLHHYAEPARLTVEYRDGRVKSGALR